MTLRGWLWKNPVIVKEIRTRMRGSRAFWIVAIHLFLLTLVIGVVYLVLTSALTSSGNVQERRYLGKAIFGLLIGLELIMISFTAPALTAGMISSERERYTYDLLQVSLLPASRIVSGKFLSGLAFVFLLLLTSVPLQGPAFMIGGIAPVEIIVSTLILLVTAIAFCAAGIFFSSLYRRTLASTVTTYAISILLVFGIPLVGLIVLVISSSAFGGRLDQLSPWVLGVLAAISWAVLSITPLGSLIASEIIYLDQQSVWFFSLSLPQNTQMTLVSPWVIYVVFYILLSGLLLWLSVRRVRQTDQ